MSAHFKSSTIWELFHSITLMCSQEKSALVYMLSFVVQRWRYKQLLAIGLAVTVSYFIKKKFFFLFFFMTLYNEYFTPCCFKNYENTNVFRKTKSKGENNIKMTVYMFVLYLLINTLNCLKFIKTNH